MAAAGEGGSHRRARALLRVSVFAHAAVVVLALAALRIVGEHTRPTFFLAYMPRHPFAAAGLVLLPLAILARERKLVVIEVATLLVALFPLMGLRAGASRAARGTRLRLLTYNVFYAKLDPAALRREIASAGADVIVLQASRSSFAATLAAELPGYTFHVDDEFVLATKLKLVDAEVPERFEDGGPASWVRYALEGPTGPLHVIDVHPISARSALFDREDPRVGIARRTRQLASAIAAASRVEGPVILAGDTNLPGLSEVARRQFDAFHDAFDEVGLGFGYTFPAKLPWMRIDRVLAGPGVRFLDVRVLPRGASDHRAVVADFEIERP